MLFYTALRREERRKRRDRTNDMCAARVGGKPLKDYLASLKD